MVPWMTRVSYQLENMRKAMQLIEMSENVVQTTPQRMSKERVEKATAASLRGHIVKDKDASGRSCVAC